MVVYQHLSAVYSSIEKEIFNDRKVMVGGFNTHNFSIKLNEIIIKWSTVHVHFIKSRRRINRHFHAKLIERTKYAQGILVVVLHPS